MVPPIWLDEFGKRRPVRPCLRCGREAPIHHFRLQDLRRLGWQPFAPAEFVNWCGHAQEFVPIPEAEGERCWLIPILGEAT
jgi:hypothetical protein